MASVTARTSRNRAEAEAERQALKLAQIQAETGVRTAATRLTDDQLKEAEGAFLRLESRTRSMSFYLEYALTNYRDPVSDKPVADAAKVIAILKPLRTFGWPLSKSVNRSTPQFRGPIALKTDS